jgi:hypothetical protein
MEDKDKLEYLDLGEPGGQKNPIQITDTQTLQNSMAAHPMRQLIPGLMQCPNNFPLLKGPGTNLSTYTNKSKMNNMHTPQAQTNITNALLPLTEKQLNDSKTTKATIIASAQASFGLHIPTATRKQEVIIHYCQHLTTRNILGTN